MYLNTDYQEAMNKDAFDLMELPDEDDDTHACTIRPQFDKINDTVNDEQGKFVPEYQMFVDNLLSAIPQHLKNIRQFIASSFESVYVILGYPGTITKLDFPPTMLWDKMVGRIVGPVCLSLGVEFLNTDLGMTVDGYKVARLLCLLNTKWSRGRKRFQALPAAVLIGNVFAATLTCAWLRRSLHQLIVAMKDLIKHNYNRLARTLHFTKLFAKKDEQWLNPKAKNFARQLCPNPSILKAVLQCKFNHWLTIPIHEELDYLRTQFIELLMEPNVGSNR